MERGRDIEWQRMQTNTRHYVIKYTYLLLLVSYWHSYYRSSVTHVTKIDSMFYLQCIKDLARSRMPRRKYSGLKIRKLTVYDMTH